MAKKPCTADRSGRRYLSVDNPATKVALAADPNDPDDFDVSEAGAELALEERRRRVGRPAGSTKEQVSLRIDKETLAKFRASGSGWQTRINDALREAASSIGADA